MKLINDFKGWNTLEYLWLALATTIITALSLYWGDTPLAIVSAVSNVVCVILVTKGKISNYIWGFVGVILYAWISYSNRIYGDTMLNLIYYAPMQIIGYKLWAKDLSKGGKTVYRTITPDALTLIGLGSLILIFVYGKVLMKLGGQVPMLDATSTILSVLAMFLMAKSYREQWYCWVIVNIVSIAMWATADTTNISALLMWIVFLVNSLIGLYNWHKASIK
ncbi:MAG: nicotinamide riboside transporter PnuC [Cetobacterium sp.]|uniref:nicotinamide riboside transporter PnuC n=1 Tax=Cetobacterium sp. TaxID=2071632 RepID=UPI003F2F6827